ncbi:hypothetical protein ABIQ69_11560 [Agromyces sp. G08B096]|uniref:Uncharacterized protein n=1 Tax=Agromyces sp. G08B096 TaxID=3156399 RepID=A0AAU7W3K2_9MICO
MVVIIGGHSVPEDKVDLFFDGKSGRRVTDAEWDESKRRLREAEALLGDAAVTWEPIGEPES